MKYIIGAKLKNKRKSLKLTVEDIVMYLKEKGVQVSAKTVYGWENDFCYPSVYIFLLLCEKYEIRDVVKEFL